MALDGGLYWFGESWGAPMCEPERHVDTPTGEPCTWCEELIEAGDQGVLVTHVDEAGAAYRPNHVDCHLRAIIGSVAHVERRCSCFVPGAEDGDPPEMTRREAARAAVAAWRWIQEQIEPLEDRRR